MRLIILFLLVATNIYSQTWTNNGPFGANITSIAIDPADSTILYVGTYGKGIYKSVNSGESWFLINNDLPQWQSKTIGSPTLPSWWFGDHYPVTTLAVRRDSSQYIYAGFDGGGVAFSNDQGNTWSSINSDLPDSASVNAFWINPDNPSFMLCGLKNSEYGLYKSLDGGLSWLLVEQVHDSSGFGNDVKDIQHVPTHPDSIFLSVGYTLFLSVDSGLSWKIINQQLGFDRLLILKNDPKHILAIVDTWFEDNILMHSTDGGQNWDFFPEGEHWAHISALNADKNGTIYVYKQDENKLWVRDKAGLSWTPQPLISDFGEFMGETFSITPFTISPHNPMHIYFGTQAGLFKSANGGANYVLKENGMINSYINDIAVNPKNQETAYTGGENGLWKTENSGQVWRRLSLMNVNVIAIDTKHPDTLYIGGDSLIRSFDGGLSFDLLIPKVIITEIEIHPVQKNLIFIGTYPSSVLKSEDFGESWSTSFFPDHGGTFRIKDIEFHQTNDSIVYFGTDYNQVNHGLYKSSDMGEKWDKISDPGLVKSIVLPSIYEDTVYVCTSNNIQVSGNGGHNFSILFDSISSNMSSILKLSDDNLKLLAGSKDKGAFELNLKTKTFKAIPGSHDPRLSAINMYSEKDFYFATNGSGVWLGKDIISSINNAIKTEALPLSFDIIGNWPNPFNNGTKIQIKVNTQAELSIRIFTVSGQLIKEYPKTKYSAGIHYINWDGLGNAKNTVSSGLYILSVSNGTTGRYHKIVLLK